MMQQQPKLTASEYTQRIKAHLQDLIHNGEVEYALSSTNGNTELYQAETSVYEYLFERVVRKLES